MTNWDMYEITLALLRKDKKGSINVEEFESLLKFRSLWLFKSLLPKDGVDKVFITALSPFLIIGDAVGTTGSSAPFTELSIQPDVPAHIISVATGATPTARINVDIVTPAELYERMTNAVTLPSPSYPCSVIKSDGLDVYGPTGATGTVYVDYYKYPSVPYIDYYIDASYNYHYLATGTYTLGAGEVYRDGTDAGLVTSQTQEIEWLDSEKMLLIAMILGDIGVAMNDQTVVQTAILERNNTHVK